MLPHHECPRRRRNMVDVSSTTKKFHDEFMKTNVSSENNKCNESNNDNHHHHHQTFKREGCSRSSFLSITAASTLALLMSPSSESIAMPPPIITSNLSNNNNNNNNNNIASTPSISSSSSSFSRETFVETVSGFVSGGALSATKTVVKYPMDTATVRLQMKNTPYSITKLGALFNGSFRGISSPLLSNIPGGAVFFACKDATKSALRDAGLPKWATTFIAVGVANIPYWAIRNPSEVIKTRQQAGMEGYGDGVSIIDAFQVAMNKTQNAAVGGSSTTGGINELYTGYFENLIYAFPADVIKFIVYEQLSGGKKNLEPLKGAAYGSLSTAVAQFITTPLDVVRNRIMATTTTTTTTDNDDEKLNEKKISYFKGLKKIADEEGLRGLFAGATPRIGKSILSGAIQFATYEDTKQKMRKLLQS